MLAAGIRVRAPEKALKRRQKTHYPLTPGIVIVPGAHSICLQRKRSFIIFLRVGSAACKFQRSLLKIGRNGMEYQG